MQLDFTLYILKTIALWEEHQFESSQCFFCYPINWNHRTVHYLQHSQHQGHILRVLDEHVCKLHSQVIRLLLGVLIWVMYKDHCILRLSNLWAFRFVIFDECSAQNRDIRVQVVNYTELVNMKYTR